MTDVTLANARIVTADAVLTGRMRIADGTIAEIDEGTTVPPGALDVEGDYLVPGLVELHTDVLERHAFPRPGVTWPTVAAVLAYDAELTSVGVTTVLDSLAVGYVLESSRRPRDPRPLVEAIRAARDTAMLRAEHFLHLRCEVSTEHVVEDFLRLVDDPLVRLVSLMDHTPGQRQFVDVGKYREYNQGKYGLTDAQIEALIARRLAEQQRYGATHRRVIVRACHAHGHPLASHDDATAAHVEEAVAAGAVVAEFPTTREAAAAAHGAGLAVLAGAPNLVCGGSHSGNISAASLARDGVLDIVSSDYAPASLLHGAFVLTDLGVPLPAAIATVTSTPAQRVGLKDRGALAAGLRGDVVRVRVTPGGVVVRGVWRAGQRIG